MAGGDKELLFPDRAAIREGLFLFWSWFRHGLGFYFGSPFVDQGKLGSDYIDHGEEVKPDNHGNNGRQGTIDPVKTREKVKKITVDMSGDFDKHCGDKGGDKACSGSGPSGGEKLIAEKDQAGGK